MLDSVLNWLVVSLPTILSMSLKAPEPTRHKAWRVRVILFGVLLSTLTLWQQSRSRGAHASEVSRLTGWIQEGQRENKESIQKLTPLLESGQRTISLLVQESKDTKSELARLRAGQASTPATLNAIINLGQRTQAAEDTARDLERLYTRQLKINTWPAGSTDANSGDLVRFFTTQFPETMDLNGVDRFFLYCVMKHKGSLDRQSYNILSKQYLQEFQTAVNPTESWRRLQRLGFLESGPPVQEPRLKEPYYSRLRGIQVP